MDSALSDITNKHQELLHKQENEIQCLYHVNEMVRLVCIYDKCKYQTRFLCPECCTSSHNLDHNKYLVSLKKIQCEHDIQQNSALKQQIKRYERQNELIQQDQKDVETIFSQFRENFLLKTQDIEQNVLKILKDRSSDLQNKSQKVQQHLQKFYNYDKMRQIIDKLQLEIQDHRETSLEIGNYIQSIPSIQDVIGDEYQTLLMNEQYLKYLLYNTNLYQLDIGSAKKVFYYEQKIKFQPSTLVKFPSQLYMNNVQIFFQGHLGHQTSCYSQKFSRKQKIIFEFKIYNFEFKTKFFFGICAEKDKNNGFFQSTGNQINFWDEKSQGWKIKGQMKKLFLNKDEVNLIAEICVNENSFKIIDSENNFEAISTFNLGNENDYNIIFGISHLQTINIETQSLMVRGV